MSVSDEPVKGLAGTRTGYSDHGWISAFRSTTTYFTL